MTWPLTSFPKGTTSLLPLYLSGMFLNTSLKETIDDTKLGISTPTAGFPGIGASIRISLAAKANLISSCKDIILLTLVPVSNFNSYFVIEGPIEILLIEAWTPNSFKTAVNLSALSTAWFLFSPCFLLTTLCKRDNGGKW